MIKFNLTLLYYIFLLTSLLNFNLARDGIKNCSDSGFCKRNRLIAKNITEGHLIPIYKLQKDTIQLKDSILIAEIDNIKDNIKLQVEFHFLFNEVVRIKVNQKNSIKKRYDQAKDFALISEPKLINFNKVKGNKSKKSYIIKYGKDFNFKVKINYEPFKFNFYKNNDLFLTFNERSLFNFEHYRLRKPSDNNELSEWEETFNNYLDPKKDGPASLSLDLSFHEFKHVYGIPSHASNFSLRSTDGSPGAYTDPFRLYNLDIFAYEVNSPNSNYGSIPFMLAHNKKKSAGIFWLNSAEMWIDIQKNKNKNSITSTHTHWMVESGVFDIFIFLGDHPKQILKQYGELTGFTALPPSFALGYHQCRWNYMNMTDVAQVDAGFDKYDIPYDVLWLDIEHTDEKRYFTWDKKNFTDPIKMQNDLAKKGRKMVTIVDPHIKNDPNYYIFKEATEKSYFVKDKDNKDFVGDCWPGKSSWVDYTKKDASEWWSSKFSLKNYNGSTENLYIWNDMNEPAVFNSVEGTMPKSNLHYGNIEHRDVHNLYGMLFHRASAYGLVKRLTPNHRPFVLSRAFFSGTQRIGAIWTGDNVANWDYMRIASPMLLSIGLSGVSFSGADIGGFFGDPTPELLVRWYQMAAFQPFFRGHAHMDSKRREPWLFGEPYTSQIRQAIRNRYQLLPFWYTLFFESSLNGTPSMRPLFLEFPNDEHTFDIDHQFMVGSSLLVHPITSPSVNNVNIYLPGDEDWYDYFTLKKYSNGILKVQTSPDKIPVFLRSGQIIPQRNTIKRASTLMVNDPITLLITLNSKGNAKGHIYLDDGTTYDYLKNNHAYREFEFHGSKLTNRKVKKDVYSVQNPLPFEPSLPNNSNTSYHSIKIDKIIILGLKHEPKSIICAETGRKISFNYDATLNSLKIENPNLNIVQDFKLIFH